MKQSTVLSVVSCVLVLACASPAQSRALRSVGQHLTAVTKQIGRDLHTAHRTVHRAAGDVLRAGAIAGGVHVVARSGPRYRGAARYDGARSYRAVCREPGQVTERVWIPERCEREWVPAEYGVRILSCGRREHYLIRPGHWRTVHVPGHWEWRTRTVCEPAHRCR